MKLLFKFNLIFILVMALGVAISGFISRNLLQSQAQQEVLSIGRLLIEQATAVRGYTSGQITKLLETQMKYEFLPQSVPSYSATEVLATLHKKYPEYAYKEATLNPTNPRDRATGWEVDIVNAFRNDAELKELVGQRDTPTGRSLYISRPLRIVNPACLVCHSSVEAAPKTMVDKYGPAKSVKSVKGGTGSGTGSGTGGSSGSTGVSGRAGAPSTYAPTSGTFAGATLPVNEALMDQAQRLLAAHLGPIARVVVKRSAGRTRQREAFFTLLLEAAPEPVRARLLADLHKLP